MGRQEDFTILFKLKDMASAGIKAIRDLLKSIKDIDFSSVSRAVKDLGDIITKQHREETYSAQKKNQEILDSSRRTFNEQKALGKSTFQERIAQINEELKIETLSNSQRRKLEEELSRRKIQIANEESKVSQKKSVDILSESIAYERLYSVLSGVTKSFIDINKQAERAEVGLNALAGDQAAIIKKQLSDFSLVSTAGYGQLVDNAQKLLLVGVKTSEVVPILKSVSTITAAMGGDADRALYAITQIASATKLRGQEALQLWNAMIPITKLLQDHLHKSGAEIKKMQEDGEITFDMVAAALNNAAKEGSNFNVVMTEIMNTTQFGAGEKAAHGFEYMARSFKDFLNPQVTFFYGVLTKIFDIFSKAPTAIKTISGLVVELGLAFVGLNIAVRGVQLVFPGFISSINLAFLAMTAIRTPAGLAIAAITGIGIAAYSASSKFRNFIDLIAYGSVGPGMTKSLSEQQQERAKKEQEKEQERAKKEQEREQERAKKEQTSNEKSLKELEEKETRLQKIIDRDKALIEKRKLENMAIENSGKVKPEEEFFKMRIDQINEELKLTGISNRQKIELEKEYLEKKNELRRLEIERNRELLSKEQLQTEEWAKKKLSVEQRIASIILKNSQGTSDERIDLEKKVGNALINDAKTVALAQVDSYAASLAQWSIAELWKGNLFGAIGGGIAAGTLSAGARGALDQIKPLAYGGIINPSTGGTIVRVAERGVPEAVVPLDNKRAMDALSSSNGSSISSKKVDLHLHLGGGAMPILAKAILNETKRGERKGRLI